MQTISTQEKTLYAGRTDKPVTLMDLACIGAKQLKKAGLLKDLDESEEINACSVKITVDVDGNPEDCHSHVQNSLHNHPIEIRPAPAVRQLVLAALSETLCQDVHMYIRQ